MKGIFKQVSILIIVFLINACSVQHQYMDRNDEKNMRQVNPNQVFNYQAPTESGKSNEQQIINMPKNAYPTNSQKLNQNFESGTSSTGPR